MLHLPLYHLVADLLAQRSEAAPVINACSFNIHQSFFSEVELYHCPNPF
jgi:hypothetical protein